MADPERTYGENLLKRVIDFNTKNLQSMTMCQIRVQFAGNEILSMNHVIRNKFEQKELSFPKKKKRGTGYDIFGDQMTLTIKTVCVTC